MPLHIAYEHDSIELVQILLDKGADVNAQNNSKQTPLHIACKCESIELVQILLNKGADVNVQNNSKQTPLHIACESDSIELVHILLDKGADVNAVISGCSVLLIAASNIKHFYSKDKRDKHLELVKLLL